MPTLAEQNDAYRRLSAAGWAFVTEGLAGLPPEVQSETVARLRSSETFYCLVADECIVVTPGIQALPVDVQARIFVAVRDFDAFTPDNDPYGEHDFGSLRVGAHKIFWKVDYYDKNLEFASPDPSDLAVTKRVLTIMLSEEY